MSDSNSPNLDQWLVQWPDGLITLDSGGRILWVSDKATALLGWTNEQLCGRSIHECLCIQSREFEHSATKCALLHSDEDEQSLMHSAYWLAQSGEYLSIDYRRIPVSIGEVAVIVSFFENRKAQHNFAELQKFASYVEKNPAAIAEFDHEGQMLFSNPSLQNLLLELGFNDEGQANIFPQQLADICHQCCNEQKNIVDKAVRVADAWFSWAFHPLEINGETTVIGYAFDVTEQKEMEEELRTARANARRDFYAKMMHELRTPLNAIVGYSDLVMLRSSHLDERDKKALRGIKIGGMQLNELISDTLDISKIEAGKMTADMEEFSVAQVVKDIQDQMQYLAEARKLDYTVLCDDDLVVLCDRKKVRQILINLISNAIKYTKEGSIFVRVRRLTPATETEDERFEIAVADTGVGIPEEQIDGLFQAYQQVREKKNVGIQGTGLGLALVKELVAVLKGEITVESVYGEGSKFTVQLPITPSFEAG